MGCGSDKDKIIEASKKFLETDLKFDKSLYGDGRASDKIIEKLFNAEK